MVSSFSNFQSFSIEILSRYDNELLHRSEVDLNISHENAMTPSRSDVAQKLAQLFNTGVNNIVIRGTKTFFGSGNSKVKVKVYNNMDQLKKIEHFCELKRIAEKSKTEMQLVEKLPRRTRKDNRKKRNKMWGTEKRRMKKAEKKNSR
ncbi:40s ribosomal protein s24 [Spraguea lophii 42_110]|uniref:40s ribosomal protein s24 n=1 Tax=Spraguea lophii (strain 42_110) TaxID=1358809 RepID=S7W8J5_SPRLO|nr:Chain SY0, 40s ribosomal protein s24 [Spraguea lophii 42_110]7QJH_RY0 Chain RY0, 40s ribosomal protein s24 [Spraguea lophii 42_110]7QJH_SY0 Chain SY0, 40s ribosomal protein s24 [Spraguea lophii 42_110]8BR3_SY0 Chain SY0, 40s ribosomal protein s24 [Spraguea lophii 42_110]8P5D_SY0 Chain SY0, 40s ribosomal protein s24 [Spraguea lophii 42_110]8P60_RY0 Chain RY0, 40s ribosomal protein s24 [Spraguea lophii 42_110]8P60_SY0 Chain SY0, 40s ribosomal protein s24 [Spraguea lophii 42_110]EPR79176.1 4